MKALFWNRLTLLFTLVLLAGCTLAGTGTPGADPAASPTAAPTQTPPRIETPLLPPVAQLTAADAGQTLHLEVGQTFTVTLEGNPSTGYAWELEPVEPALIAQVGGPVAAPESDQVGAPAMLTLTFRATAEGYQTLRLVYHRSWEKDAPPASSFEVNLSIGQEPGQTPPPTSTPDARPTPTQVVFPRGRMKGWLTYDSADYGFSFQYPPDWKLEPAFGTLAGHAVYLTPAARQARLVVAFKRAAEEAQIGRTGVGSGELLPRGSVLLAGQEIRRSVLVFEGKDLTVLYICPGCMTRGKVEFNFSLDYLGSWTDGGALAEGVEAQADLIVASVKMK